MADPAPDVGAAIADLRRAVEVAERQEARLPELRALGQLISLSRREGADASADEQRLEALCAHFGSDSRLPELQRARTILRPTAGEA